MTSNPWHSVSIGSNAPEEVNAIIEIQQGSKTKYELDKETGMLILDRILYSELTFPVNYGLIPKTYYDDGDPLDILVLCSQKLMPSTIVHTTVVGGMAMIDSGQRDDKIIAVTTNDPYLKHIRSLNDIPEESRAMITSFFQYYKRAEGKEVIVEDLFDKKKAHQIIKQSMQDYKKKFSLLDT